MFNEQDSFQDEQGLVRESQAERKEDLEFIEKVLGRIEKGEAAFIYHTTTAGGVNDVVRKGFEEQWEKSFGDTANSFIPRYREFEKYFHKNEFPAKGITEYVFDDAVPSDAEKRYLASPLADQKYLRFTHGQQVVDNLQRLGDCYQTFLIPESDYRELFGDESTGDVLIKKYPGIIRQIIMRLAPEVFIREERDVAKREGTALNRFGVQRKILISIHKALGRNLYPDYQAQQKILSEGIKAVPDRVFGYEASSDKLSTSSTL